MRVEGKGLEFAVSYCRWAFGQWTSEIEQNFPLTRTIPNETTDNFLAAFEQWPTEDRLRLARALTKRSHPHGAAALGEPLSAEEKDLVDKFKSKCDQEELRRQWSGQTRWFKPRQVSQRAVRALLRKEIKPALELILGKNREDVGGGNWHYRTPVGRWTITTFVDLGGRTDLEYFQAVNPEVDISSWYTPRIGPLEWLGIAGSTYWDNVSREDVPATAAALAMACKRFVEAAPQLLPG